MSDRIAVMSQGRVEQVGPPEGDLRGARHRLRRRLPRRLEPDGCARRRASATAAAGSRSASSSWSPARATRDTAGDCKITIRPERVDIEAQGTTGENRMPGDGRAGGLRRLDAPGDPAPGDRPDDPGVDPERRRRRRRTAPATRSRRISRARRCGCCRSGGTAVLDEAELDVSLEAKPERRSATAARSSAGRRRLLTRGEPPVEEQPAADHEQGRDRASTSRRR